MCVRCLTHANLGRVLFRPVSLCTGQISTFFNLAGSRQCCNEICIQYIFCLHIFQNLDGMLSLNLIPPVQSKLHLIKVNISV